MYFIDLILYATLYYIYVYVQIGCSTWNGIARFLKKEWSTILILNKFKILQQISLVM